MDDREFKADIFSKTAAEWTAENPFLARNDLGIESDTGKQKIGVGLRWADTSYVPARSGSVQSSQITTIVSLTQAAYDALATKDPATLYVIT